MRARSILNCLCLSLFCLPLVAQHPIPPTVWKEYLFPKDRFAITFPQEVIPHDDTVNVGMTVYSVHLSADSVISIRSKPADNCVSDLSSVVKDNAAASHSEPPKTIAVAGHDGFESITKKNDHWSYTRLWCGDRMFFVASAGWLTTEPKPPVLDRILNSFRIVPSNPKP